MRKKFDLNEHPHRRLNLLSGEWVLVSPHRARRPWQGQMEEQPQEKMVSYDPACYLCPGNQRAGGKVNPPYQNTLVFDNDFSALQAETPTRRINREDLLIAEGEAGICRVICFSPRHDLTLAEMPVTDIRQVVDVWTEQYLQLGRNPRINYVQIFENKGAIMGCSNPHPHGQIWAQRSIPVEPARETKCLKSYLQKERRCLLCDYLELETEIQERIVVTNQHFTALVPFWAVWPFELLLIGRRHYGSFTEMDSTEKDGLAEIIRQLTIRYDNLFRISFPYSAGFHQSPTDRKAHEEWHFHMHFYPPLLRSATIKKFMVGYEMLGNPQRDITPEWSAGRLRELSDIHYKKQK